MKACVAGATGYLGSAVVEELGSRNIGVMAVARNTKSLAGSVHHQPKNTTTTTAWFFVDATNPQENYATALASVTTAISCLAAGYTSSSSSSSSCSGTKRVNSSSNDFWAIDRDANIRFGREAIQAGVQQLILVATLEGKASRIRSAFTDAKEEAVDVLQAECELAGVVFTVIRPTAFYKDLTDHAFDSVLKKGHHLVLGRGSCRINPIAREDVASFIADCVQSGRGGDFCVGGPDVFTYREIGVLAGKVIGNQTELRIVTFPLWILRLAAVVFAWFGLLFRAARRQAALMNWMIFASTHDAIAPCCGKRRLEDEYTKKYELTKNEECNETSCKLPARRPGLSTKTA